LQREKVASLFDNGGVVDSGSTVAFESVVKDYSSGYGRRGALRAVDHVSFSVPRGEVVGLVGPNRAGKTTLVKILLSLCEPTSGRVERLGKPAATRSTLARVGYVHENQAFPRYLTAASLLEYYGALSLVAEGAVRQRAPKLLERVGLADRAREPIARFSKGMIQRLAVAQALINDPDLLVCDEPSEGLDLPGRQMLRDVIAERKALGRAVLYVSHVLNEVEQLCDRVAVVVAGRLAHFGPLTELTQPAGGQPAQSLEQCLDRLYRSDGNAASPNVANSNEG
jgi:ABC-2 type transport system ATP-binding protein